MEDRMEDAYYKLEVTNEEGEVTSSSTEFAGNARHA
jgi:hypothetical protein